MSKTILTAESVTASHVDKIADQISDAVLDEALRQDPKSRVACETFLTKGLIVVGGEITTKAKLDYTKIVRDVAERLRLDFSGTELFVAVHEQSPDIAHAVDGGDELGAGDQSISIGYATNETEEMLPLEYAFARRITNRLEKLFNSGEIKGLKGDGKSQVSAEFEDGRFTRFTKIVVSVQHSEDKDLKELKSEIGAFVIGPVFEEFDLTETEILINPSGKFVVGGVEADTGLTGRKIVVDAYGPTVPVGGGAFSGKDPSKVDRSGAYMARHIAKNVVAAGLAERCGVQLAYAIGKANPLALNIDTFGTGTVSDGALTDAVRKYFDLRPREIIRQLDLLKPAYAATSSGGHFGRGGFTWENIEGAQDFRAFVLQ